MCGIFGFFDSDKNILPEENFLKMGKVIEHRGPDGTGFYYNKSIGLGNTRLAILDIEHGDQPFISDDGNIVVVQNGEIFNHVELSEELSHDGFLCRTHCDTEVILRLYERDGISGVSKLNGMFAIAIYDKVDDAVYLIRDRVGEKPLYLMEEGGRYYFGSEIKSILQVCNERSLDPNALNQFLAFNFIPPPLTIFSNIKHVMPGHWVKIKASHVDTHCWWDLVQVPVETREEDEWIQEFNNVLNDAVKLRLRADVPFGAFLSGGVDSSTVLGIMSRHMSIPVETFCIGFDDPKYDESPYAEEAANRFHAKHTMEKVDPNMINLWPMATYHCDQPHGDVSFLPTYKVAELASKQVKMVLTGDGADELFAGYDKYKNFFNQYVLTEENKDDFYISYTRNIELFSDEQRLKLFKSDFLKRICCLNSFEVTKPYFDKSNNMDEINQALYLDMMMLLPGNNLVKPDRMGMAVSLENRAPFLDYRMMELAFRMPGSMKLKNGETKYIYKKAVRELIGENLAYRKKQMFTVPVGEWFKNELYDLCENLLLSERAVDRGIFDKDVVADMLKSHCSGEVNYTREIRALMAVEIWFREFLD